MNGRSCLYEGWVRHRRFSPVEHRFRYRVFMLYLDLAETESVFRGRWLWSATGPNLFWFRRGDHAGDPSVPLDTTIRDLVASRTGRRPAGPIGLLTNLRTFGYCMNPVCFYYCWDLDGSRVETIVAEVHNTPWGETHCYVLDETLDEGRGTRKRYRHDKEFHVSPFMGMNQRYDWRFIEPGERLVVHIENQEQGRRVLDSTISLERRPITGASLAGVLLRHPFMTGKVILAIYWQALKLWIKGAPFHPHPKPAAAVRKEADVS